MQYVISDIHGCYKEYLALLEKIKFSSNDYLYVLGDAVDRGPEPMAVLKDLMGRDNMTFIMGNHDFLLWYFAKSFGLSLDSHANKGDMMDFKLYLEDGGMPTVEDFLKLPETERKEIYDFLRNANIYEEIFCEGKRYILVHAGISGFEESKPLGEYKCMDFITDRIDYSRRYFPDENTYVITGHTPTFYIDEDFFKKKLQKPEIYRGNGHIAIDCGCAYGGRLAAYCLETGQATYVDSG